ncbi:endonuclease NucS [Microbacterium aquilitoris]|uniref:Endonuclease NucS n=1 Tax=Microbacterium aquilitoris TaxID=3067307 RepID=A0ABU3GGG1_9MICO|nr:MULTISPECIES: endonuclease NucS [unclassified Microbacterium]MDT3329465.1 endonuclease NucS [Microbacterium sp. KSW-18]MDT3345297.1 endonuclease NucS [Microbacterium sp. KSW2-22]
MRLVIARCSVDYTGRLNTHLPPATRLIMVKADGTVAFHRDIQHQPLNWMSPPCTLTMIEPGEDDIDVVEKWRVTHAKTGDELTIRIYEVLHDSSHELGVDPGLVKDGVEADLQRLLAEQVGVIGENLTLVRREFPTAIGPVDLLLRNPEGGTIAVEVKRRGDIDGVEQLTRYLELLGRDPHLAPVTGVFAAQEIKPQAKVLATDRGIRCVTLDYDEMKGIESGAPRLF